MHMYIHIIYKYILTKLEENELVVLDDALEIVLGDHEDTLVYVDLGEANGGEAERRETKFADETPHAGSESVCLLFSLG